MRERSIRMPPSQTQVPATLCPAPRMAMSNFCVRAKLTAAITSATPAQRAISPGRLSIIPLKTFRASSYPESPGRSSSPRKDDCNFTTSSVATAAPVCGSMHNLPVSMIPGDGGRNSSCPASLRDSQYRFREWVLIDPGQRQFLEGPCIGGQCDVIITRAVERIPINRLHPIEPEQSAVVVQALVELPGRCRDPHNGSGAQRVV